MCFVDSRTRVAVGVVGRGCSPGVVERSCCYTDRFPAEGLRDTLVGAPAVDTRRAGPRRGSPSVVRLPDSLVAARARYPLSSTGDFAVGMVRLRIALGWSGECDVPSLFLRNGVDGWRGVGGEWERRVEKRYYCMRGECT